MDSNPIVWADATGAVFRIGETSDIDPPSTFAASLGIYRATNGVLVKDITDTLDTAVWRLAGSAISKDGTPQTVQPFPAPLQDQQDFLRMAQLASDDLQTLANATFSNNAQRDAAIRRLAVIQRATLRALSRILRSDSLT